MGYSVKARAQFTPRGSGGQFVQTVFSPAAQDATQAMAQIVLGHAQEIVHVRSGQLRDSGHVEAGDNDGKTAVSMVVFDAPHAAYVEFGTGRRGAESPMSGKGPYKESWAGMEPIPYLRTALDTARTEALAAAASTVSLSLRS